MIHDTWALVLGGASCVWDDLRVWEAMYGRPWDGVVIAANDIGAHWPHELHHWVSLHPDKFDRWRALRTKHGYALEGIVTWAKKMRMASQHLADNEIHPWAGGSSGMFAVQVAREVGCTKAILCGIPMTSTPHFAETKEQFHTQWLAATGHWKAWTSSKEQMLGWAKSMSGRTQELLGAPTLDWLFTENDHESKPA